MTVLQPDGVVVFRFFRPGASRVSVTGDFNRWVEGVTPMRPAGDGWWEARVRIEPGEYRFRYVADGVRYADYASYGVEAAKDGWNAVLMVPARKAPLAPAASLTHADRPSRAAPAAAGAEAAEPAEAAEADVLETAGAA